MQYPGTITLPNEYFTKVVEYAARSFQPHGFIDIILIGDSGGNQQGLAAGRRGAQPGVGLQAGAGLPPRRILQRRERRGGWLKSQGEAEADIGSHAGITDTSQLLAVHPEGVRMAKLVNGERDDGSGVTGDATHASIGYGGMGLELKIQAALRQYERLRAAQR